MTDKQKKNLGLWIKANTYKPNGYQCETEAEALRLIFSQWANEAKRGKTAKEQRKSFFLWAQGLPSCLTFEFLNFQSGGDDCPALHALERIKGKSLAIEESEAETELIGLIFEAVQDWDEGRRGKSRKLYALAGQLAEAAAAMRAERYAIRCAEEETIKAEELQAAIYKACDKMDGLEAELFALSRAAGKAAKEQEAEE